MEPHGAVAASTTTGQEVHLSWTHATAHCPDLSARKEVLSLQLGELDRHAHLDLLGQTSKARVFRELGADGKTTPEMVQRGWPELAVEQREA